MAKIFSNLFFLALALGGARGASIKCEKTVTTATLSGFKKSPTEKKLCSGDLIFEETFDNFDLDVWQHDITLNGDRVSFFGENISGMFGFYICRGIFTGMGVSMVHKQPKQLVH